MQLNLYTKKGTDEIVIFTLIDKEKAIKQWNLIGLDSSVELNDEYDILEHKDKKEIDNFIRTLLNNRIYEEVYNIAYSN